MEKTAKPVKRADSTEIRRFAQKKEKKKDGRDRMAAVQS